MRYIKLFLFVIFTLLFLLSLDNIIRIFKYPTDSFNLWMAGYLPPYFAIVIAYPLLILSQIFKKKSS